MLREKGFRYYLIDKNFHHKSPVSQGPSKWNQDEKSRMSWALFGQSKGVRMISLASRLAERITRPPSQQCCHAFLATARPASHMIKPRSRAPFREPWLFSLSVLSGKKCSNFPWDVELPPLPTEISEKPNIPFISFIPVRNFTLTVPCSENQSVDGTNPIPDLKDFQSHGD